MRLLTPARLLPLARGFTRPCFVRPSRTFAWLPSLSRPEAATAPVPTPESPPLPPSPPPPQASSVQPEIRLRDYQEECIQSILKQIGEGQKRLGASLATGSGKTVIFTQLIDRIPQRSERASQTLILAHRKELIEQATMHCRRAYPRKTIEAEMGKIHASGASDITVASIKSLLSGDRLDKYNPENFKLILVDEAHHIVAPTYKRILEHFNLEQVSESSPILVGVSATFSRADGLKLGSFIDYIAYHRDYIDMMKEKWLCDATFTTVESQADLSGVRNSKHGDFNTRELSIAVNTNKTNDVIIRTWFNLASDRKSTLVFGVDVDHVQCITTMFREKGIDARYLTGKTPQKQRIAELEAFKRGEYPVLVNCGLFTEGTDIPNIDCVLLARPTRSKNLLVQMIGRGLRLYPGKKNCHIIDMVASIEKGIVTVPMLVGLEPNYELKDTPLSDIEKIKDETPPPSPNIDPNSIELRYTNYDDILDLLRDNTPDDIVRSQSSLAWVCVSTDKSTRYVISEKSGNLVIEQPRGSSTYDVKFFRKLSPRAKSGSTYGRPTEIASRLQDLSNAVSIADAWAKQHFFRPLIERFASWRRKEPTEAQVDHINQYLPESLEITADEVTKGEAADIITKLHNGAKASFAAAMAQNKKTSAEKKATQRLGNQSVSVGPLHA